VTHHHRGGPRRFAATVGLQILSVDQRQHESDLQLVSAKRLEQLDPLLALLSTALWSTASDSSDAVISSPWMASSISSARS